MTAQIAEKLRYEGEDVAMCTVVAHLAEFIERLLALCLFGFPQEVDAISILNIGNHPRG